MSAVPEHSGSPHGEGGDEQMGFTAAHLDREPDQKQTTEIDRAPINASGDKLHPLFADLGQRPDRSDLDVHPEVARLYERADEWIEAVEIALSKLPVSHETASLVMGPLAFLKKAVVNERGQDERPDPELDASVIFTLAELNEIAIKKAASQVQPSEDMATTEARRDAIRLEQFRRQAIMMGRYHQAQITAPPTGPPHLN